MAAETPNRIAVVGMGNLLLSDDGVGVHVLHKLRQTEHDGVQLIDAGTAVIHAADCLRGFNRILVIDAVKGGQSPGTVYLMDGDAVLENDFSLSVHALGLKTALRFLAPDETPAVWMLIGVEPENLGYGMRLSPPVWSALADVVRTAERVIGNWVE